MTSTLKLTYGIKQGELTHVADVVSGIGCDCVCPACGEKLVAKKGSSRQHHFAHANVSECKYGVETALHLAAKKILEQKMEITLPEIEVQFYSSRASFSLSPERSYKIDKVVLESRVGKIIPDVLAYINGRPLLIEICVTHKVSHEKGRYIKDELGLSSIEIDLSRASRELGIEDIEKLVIGAGKHKKWLFNAEANAVHHEALQRAKVFKMVHRSFAIQVDGCPISARTFNGRPYANVTHDCNGCERLLMRDEDTITCGVVSQV